MDHIFSDRFTEQISAVVVMVTGTSALYLGCQVAGTRLRHARAGWARPTSSALRRISLLGFLIAVTSPAANARGERWSGHSSRNRPRAALPWSETSRSPPPHPLVQARADTPPPWRLGDILDGRTSGRSPEPLSTRVSHGGARWRPTHPAIHGLQSSTDSSGLVPLFPRAGHRAPPAKRVQLSTVLSPRGDDDRHNDERSWALDGFEGFYSLRPRSDSARHTVQSGETLWSIAADVLKTDDPRRIARYWPRIHRANRAVIGIDPSLIFPGQVLSLPPE